MHSTLSFVLCSTYPAFACEPPHGSTSPSVAIVHHIYIYIYIYIAQADARAVALAKRRVRLEARVLAKLQKHGLASLTVNNVTVILKQAYQACGGVVIVRGLYSYEEWGHIGLVVKHCFAFVTGRM